jgi:hypothetical protein
MTQQHPITPPPELVQQWREAPEFSALSPCVIVTVTTTKLQDIATQAAQWGADQELDACCEWINSFQNKFVHAHDLRLVRRPKTPSLKEQALLSIDTAVADYRMSADVANIVRRALEQLPDHTRDGDFNG